MPLTISHPAASIPLTRIGLSFSALVIGSMTPDFPYFIPFLPFRNSSHTIPGLLIDCLPWGLLALAAFHFLLKRPALALLPDAHRQRLDSAAGSFSFLPLRRLILIALSILAGAATHLLWDSFTHPEGWMVQRFPLLQSTLFSIGNDPVPVYQFLQHASTLLGGMLLILWYIRWYKSTDPVSAPLDPILTPSARRMIAASMIAIAFAVALISGIIAIPAVQSSLYLRRFAGHVFITGVSLLLLEWVLFSLYWRFRLKK